MKKTIQNNLSLLPKHVAIIMDGNGRWAKKNKLKVALGHRTGVISLREIIRESNNLGIKSLSIYAFSTENWKRSTIEVSALMDLLSEFFTKDIDELNDENVKVLIIGDVEGMPEPQRTILKNSMALTQNNTGMILNVALNYGGRSELIRAAKLIAENYKNGEISLDDVDEDYLANMLYTKGQLDVDLLIRTSGEMRLSNFLLYQCAYAEFVFPKVLWPDFTVEEYHKALLEYMSRDRRFGGRNTDE
ncbi:MAG: isoprenyl transferase [Christensenellaceae bacterium]|nr:isoprenyl transferase [Christensenellaceae bacterium]